MPDLTLRELCQAVVNAGPTECIWPVNAPTSALLKAMMPEVGDKASPLYDTGRAILAALDAEAAAAEARGYARAMGEVDTACLTRAESGDRRYLYAQGYQDACVITAEWARERAQLP